jgi:integrase
MSVYADKKDGQLTGRFRVDLTRKGFKNYRARHDTHAAAKADEARVKASWDAGNPVEAYKAPEEAVAANSMAAVMEAAKGSLWEGDDTEDTAWARLGIVADLLGRNTKLDDIDTQMVDGLIKKLRATRGSSNATVNRFMSGLRTFLTWAKARKYRTVPLEDIAFDWKNEVAGRIRWISWDEQRAMELFFTDPSRPKEHQDTALAVWELIQIAIATGCRRNELLFAQAGQVRGNLLTVWADQTKTEDPRTIPMTPKIAAMFRALIVSGRMPTIRGLRSWWQRMAVALNLDNDDAFVFHITRHTCATRLLDAGVHLLVMKEWLGHKTIETTLRYSHVKPENLSAALSKLGEHEALLSVGATVSGDFNAPHSAPHGGVSGHFHR